MTSCAWLWVYVGLALTLLELIVPGFILCFFGLAAASVGVLRAIVGETFNATWQFAAFSVLSILYIVLLRRLLKRVFMGEKSDAAQGLKSEYIGRTGRVTEAVNPPQTGRVLIGDAEWTAASDASIAAGVDVRVVAQSNLTMTVKPLLTLLFVVLACVVCAEKQPYSRYTSIVDRQMFGPLPDDFDPTKMPSDVAKSSATRRVDAETTKKEEQLKSAINFSMINVTPEGEVKVGFTDKTDSKVPRNYYMSVGEECNGWVVNEADPETATMTISKDDIEVTLTIGGDSSKDDKATVKARGNSGMGTSSFRERRRTRKEREDLEKEQNRLLREQNARLMEDLQNRKENAEQRESEQKDLRNELNLLREKIYQQRKQSAHPVEESHSAQETATSDEGQSQEESEGNENNDAE